MVHTFLEQDPDYLFKFVHGPSIAEYDSHSSKDPLNWEHVNYDDTHEAPPKTHNDGIHKLQSVLFLASVLDSHVLALHGSVIDAFLSL